MAGEYTSYRDIQSARVEPDGAGLEIAFENVLESRTIAAFPDGSDPTDLK